MSAGLPLFEISGTNQDFSEIDLRRSKPNESRLVVDSSICMTFFPLFARISKIMCIFAPTFRP